MVGKVRGFGVLAPPVRQAIVIRQKELTPIDVVRRGALYGAALGMLAGLAAVTFQGEIGREAIVIWRNWIVGLALAGLTVGLVPAIRLKLNRRNTDFPIEPPA